MKIKKYIVLMKQEVKDNFSHFSNSIFRILTFWIILFIFLNLWQVVYAGKGEIIGFTLTQLFWYFTLAEVMTFSGPSDSIEEIGEEVRSGSISNSLLKPINYCFVRFVKYFSRFLTDFILIGAGGILFTYVLIGSLKITFTGILLTGIAIALGAFINFLLILAIGLSAFWLEDSTSLSWIYQKFVFILGGMMIPLEFYPSWLENLSKALPTSYFMYYPAKLFVHFDVSFLSKVLIGQVSWIIVLIVIVILVYRKGVKEVNINGG